MTKSPTREDPDPTRLIRLGGQVDRATATLRLFGDALDPDEVTALLGHAPSRAVRLGEVHFDKKRLTAKTGSWLLYSPLPRSEPVEMHLIELMGQVTDDLAVWHLLGERFKVDLHCGLFLDGVNRGFMLAPGVCNLVAERGITITVDIYCP